MKVSFSRSGIMIVLVALLVGCNWHKNYQQNLRQGQWLRPYQVKQLKQGMTHQDVAHIMGSPVKKSLDNRYWFYPEYHAVKGQVKINRHLTLVFNQAGRVVQIIPPRSEQRADG